MSECDGPRRRKNVVAKQPSADDDVMTAGDDVTTSRVDCRDVIHGIWARLISRLHQPVDASSLAVFRVLFGENNVCAFRLFLNTILSYYERRLSQSLLVFTKYNEKRPSDINRQITVR